MISIIDEFMFDLTAHSSLADARRWPCLMPLRGIHDRSPHLVAKLKKRKYVVVNDPQPSFHLRASFRMTTNQANLVNIA